MRALRELCALGMLVTIVAAPFWLSLILLAVLMAWICWHERRNWGSQGREMVAAVAAIWIMLAGIFSTVAGFTNVQPWGEGAYWRHGGLTLLALGVAGMARSATVMPRLVDYIRQHGVMSKPSKD